MSARPFMVCEVAGALRAVGCLAEGDQAFDRDGKPRKIAHLRGDDLGGLMSVLAQALELAMGDQDEPLP